MDANEKAYLKALKEELVKKEMSTRPLESNELLGPLRDLAHRSISIDELSHQSLGVVNALGAKFNIEFTNEILSEIRELVKHVIQQRIKP